MSRRAAFSVGMALVLATRPLHAAEDTSRAETFERDGVALTLRMTPPRVELARDVEVQLELTHPEGLEVSLPERFDDRFEGFRLEGSYEGESLTAAGIRRRVLHLRARPLPAAERYRIAPFPIRIHDPRRGPGADTWFPTRPVVLETTPLLASGPAPDGVAADLRPLWVRPSVRSVLRGAGLGLLAAGGLAAVVWIIRKLRRRVVLARMAPRERALLELRELLERDLPAKGRVKEFYGALTLVVRRYIERRHGVRAPEQTTEEFLQEAARHPSFTPATLARLRDFLDSADLVKFAGVAATGEMVGRSVASARTYLEGEAAEDVAPRRRSPR